MRLLRKINGPIALLALLGTVELDAGSRFYRERQLKLFIAISAICIRLAATVYWIDWIVRRRVTNFQICILIGIGCWASVEWNKANRSAAMIVGVLATIGTGIILGKLLPHGDSEQQEVYRQAYPKQATSAAPAVTDFVSFAMFATLTAIWWIRDGSPVTLASVIYLPLPIWFLWRTIFHIVIKPRDEDCDPISTDSGTSQGAHA